MFIDVWIYVNDFALIPFIYLSVFMSITCCFYFYSSIVELKVIDDDTPVSSFNVQDWISYPTDFDFLYKVEYFFLEIL